MENDLGPAGQGVFHWRDREATGSVGFPQPARLPAIATRAHLDPVGDHERRIEPDSELPDQREVGLFPGIARKGFEKLARPAVGNGSQVSHQLIVGHADAVIPDDQLALRLSRVDHDLERARFAVGLLGERDVAHLVERIRCVGNQLADRDLAALVKGMRKEVEKLLDLGLECEVLCFSCGCHRRHSQSRRSARQRRSGGYQVLSIRGTLISNFYTNLVYGCKSLFLSNLQLQLWRMQEPEAVKIGTSLTKWHTAWFEAPSSGIRL